MKSSVLTTLVLGCALWLSAPLWVSAADDAAASGRKHAGKGAHAGGPVDAALAKLTLTDEQKTKIQGIKEKFRADMQAWQKAHKDEIEAAKSGNDKEKKAALRDQTRQKMDGLVNDIKGVLNEEQKTQFQQAIDAARAAHGKHGGGQGK